MSQQIDPDKIQHANFKSFCLVIMISGRQIGMITFRVKLGVPEDNYLRNKGSVDCRIFFRGIFMHQAIDRFKDILCIWI